MKNLLEKLLSGRYYMTVIFSLAYCIGIVGCLYLTAKGKLQIETFLGIWSGFTPMVILIAEWYFKREDRQGGGVK